MKEKRRKIVVFIVLKFELLELHTFPPTFILRTAVLVPLREDVDNNGLETEVDLQDKPQSLFTCNFIFCFVFTNISSQPQRLEFVGV